jgi:hypothetical protein
MQFMPLFQLLRLGVFCGHVSCNFFSIGVVVSQGGVDLCR